MMTNAKVFMCANEWVKAARQLPVQKYLPIIPAAYCKDGFEISIQASEYNYCSPRINEASIYTSFELGYPSKKDELITEYAEDKEKPTDTVYGYVPVHVVNELIEKHGGIVGCMVKHFE